MKREEGAGYRHARLEGLIFQELRALLRDDITDPALGSVRFTNIALSVDFRHVRIHFGVVATKGKEIDNRKNIESALIRATSFLRAQLAIALDLKRVPDLRFVFDGILVEEDL